MGAEVGGLAKALLESESEEVAELAVPAQAPALQAISDEQAVEIAKAALNRVGEYYYWAGPLLEAVARGATGPAVFATSWGGTGAHCLTPDLDKHEAYVTRMREAFQEACSWLLPLLDAAGAVVIVSPGVLCFMVSHLGPVAVDIPQLLPLTRLTPWVDPGESMH